MGWLVSLGLSPRAAKFVGFALIALAAALAFYAVLHAYGRERYKAGKADENKVWVEASNKLIQKSQNAGTKASTAAAARQADFAAMVEDEKERIDAANAEGSSPFDVLFNGS